MLKVICLLLMLFSTSCHISKGTDNSRVREKSFYSDALASRWYYNVYLPEDYDSSKEYPVIYLLHGAYGDYKQWNDVNHTNGGGRAKEILDEVIASGQLPPTIVIMPDGWNSWYTNIPSIGSAKSTNMQLAFEQDLFSHVEKTYSVKNDRQFRAIAGNSMGGHGAIGFGMRNPDYFSTVVALSPAITCKDIPEAYIPEKVKEWAEKDFPYLFGNPFDINKWRAVSYENIYETFETEENSNPVRFYIRVGDADTEAPYPNSEYLEGLLTDSGIEHEYTLDPGEAHTFDYWNTILGDALAYIGEGFSE